MLLIFGSALCTQIAHGQLGLEGQVSYLSSQNVYVKFKSTEHIEIGDTLFVQAQDSLIPGLVVKHKSSISCVCSPLEERVFEAGDIFIAISKNENVIISKPETEIVQEVIPPEESGEEVILGVEPDEISTLTPTYKEKIRGRLSATSYSNAYSGNYEDVHRFRYTFSLQADHINHSPLSLETFISYRHRLNEDPETASNLADHLKIYSFSGTYKMSEKTKIALGRKVNRNLANIGAVDGGQFESAFGNFTTGAFIGFRPDYTDFSINPDLFQTGIYIAHSKEGKHGRAQTSLGLVDQQNNWNTDRRFVYFQQANAPVKNLNVFASFELDLFEKVDSVSTSTANLTSIYLSVRFRPSRKLTLFASYDARQNVIYYESYKSYIDQLIDQETRQGYRLRATYRPVKRLSVGVTAGYRMQKNNPYTSKNLRGYLTVSRVPVIKVAATLSATLLQSGYLEGQVYGVRINRQLIKRRLSGGAGFRMVQYTFPDSGSELKQNIASVNFALKILKDLSFSTSYEGTFKGNETINRMRFNLTKRFR